MPVLSLTSDLLATSHLRAGSLIRGQGLLERAQRHQRLSKLRAEQHPEEKACVGESYSRKFKQRSSKDIGPDISAACKMAVAEAEALGIPTYALPRLSNEPSLEEAREVQEKIESIIASFTSANI